VVAELLGNLRDERRFAAAMRAGEGDAHANPRRPDFRFPMVQRRGRLWAYDSRMR
jgi:hypothetical protein